MKRDATDPRPLKGAILIALLIMIAVVIFFLDAIQRKAESNIQLVAILPQSYGLQVGTDVWLAGAPVGRVVRIGLLPGSRDTLARVAAVFVVPRSRRNLIRGDTRLRLTKRNPLAQPVLDLVPGSPSAPPLPPGDTLRPPSGGTRRKALDEARGLYLSLDSLMNTAGVLQQRADARRAGFQVLNDRVGAARLELARLRRDYRRGSLARLLEDPSFQGRLDTVAHNTDRLAAALNRRAAQLDTLLGAAGDTTRSARLRALGRRLGRLSAEFAQGDGTLPRLARDSAIFLALDSVRLELDSLIAVTRRDPLRYVF